MNTNALNRLITVQGGGKKILVCQKCGSLNIQVIAWVDPNYHSYAKEFEDSINDRWCEDCQENVNFCTLAEFEYKMHQDFLKNPVININKWVKLPYLMKLKIWREKLRQDEPIPSVTEESTDKSDIKTLKEKYVRKIKNLLKSLNLDSLDAMDVDEGCSPILHEDPYDGNNSYTLDTISINEDGTLSFDASSCCDNIEYNEKSVSLEKLIGIYEWLEDNIENLKENIENS